MNCRVVQRLVVLMVFFAGFVSCQQNCTKEDRKCSEGECCDYIQGVCKTQPKLGESCDFRYECPCLGDKLACHPKSKVCMQKCGYDQLCPGKQCCKYFTSLKHRVCMDLPKEGEVCGGPDMCPCADDNLVCWRSFCFAKNTTIEERAQKYDKEKDLYEKRFQKDKDPIRKAQKEGKNPH